MKSTIHEHQKNNFKLVSKTTLKNIGLALLATIAFASCTPNEDGSTTVTKIQNVSPENAKTFSADEALQPITFRWTPLVPKPREAVTYKLRVWQLMQGQNGIAAMRNQPKITRVIDTNEITVTGLYTGPCKPPYLCDFIWSVEATISIDGVPSNTTTVSNPTLFGF